MGKRFVLPATTFIAGFVTWILCFVTFTIMQWQTGIPMWAALATGLVPGILIFFSGARCRQVGGPRIGNIIRSIVILVFAILTWWKIGSAGAAILLLAAVSVAAMALTAKKENESGAIGLDK